MASYFGYGSKANAATTTTPTPPPATAYNYIVVGSGATGLAAVYTLCKYSPENASILLLESESRVGGHAHTVTIPSSGEKCDIGFMVMNNTTYPNMVRIFNEVSVALEMSDMSLCVHDQKSFSWSFQSDLNWLFNNIAKPRLWSFLLSHRHFCKKAIQLLSLPVDETATVTIKQFSTDIDPFFIDKWLLPFISAVWSVGYGDADDFAIRPLLQFMHNHRFLGLDVLQWKTPAGRSEAYVNAVIKACGSKLTIQCNMKATSIHSAAKVIHYMHAATGTTTSSSNETGMFSYRNALILCCNAPIQASLHPPAEAWLNKFQVSKSMVYAHNQPDNLPQNKSDWSSWNVLSSDSKVSAQSNARVTYWVSKIQNLKDRNVFVSVNPPARPNGTFFEIQLSHPIMDISSEKAQQESYKHQGIGDVYYAGAWLRHGFHEDAFFTGINAAKLALKEIGHMVPIEFPTASNIMPAVPLEGVTVHTRYNHSNNSDDKKGVSMGNRVFSYPLYLFKFDAKTPPRGFYRNDHFGDVSIPLDTLVRKTLLEKIGIWPNGKIEVLCNLRYAGYTFNPITPYYIYNDANVLIALLCEVHNTPWGEKCIYAMKVCGDGTTLVPDVHGKVMHVSPFHPSPKQSKWQYKFTLYKNCERLDVDAYETATSDGNGDGAVDDKVSTNAAALNAYSVKKFTATLDVSLKKTHNVYTGSWRSVMQVYYQAVLLIVSGHKMYDYSVPVTPYTHSCVWPWLTLLLPAAVNVHQHRHHNILLTASFILASLSGTFYNRSSYSYIFLLLGIVVGVLMCCYTLMMEDLYMTVIGSLLSLVFFRKLSLRVCCATLISLSVLSPSFYPMGVSIIAWAIIRNMLFSIYNANDTAWAIAFIHAIPASIFGLYYIDHAFAISNPFYCDTPTDDQVSILNYCFIGYLFHDLLFTFVGDSPASETVSNIIHHVAFGLVSTVNGSLRLYSNDFVWLIIGEVSTIPLALMKLDPARSNVWSILFAITFFICRICIFPIGVYHMYLRIVQYRDHATVLSDAVFAMVFFAYGLNLFWFSIIIKKVLKIFKPKALSPATVSASKAQ